MTQNVKVVDPTEAHQRLFYFAAASAEGLNKWKISISQAAKELDGAKPEESLGIDSLVEQAKGNK